jgi:hypothetical protein
MSSFSLRMDDHDYEYLQAMALLTGTSMAELVRAAIGEAVRRFVQTARHDGSVADQLRQRQKAVALLEQRAEEATADMGDPDGRVAAGTTP